MAASKSIQMAGRYLLDTNIAVLILNQKIDLTPKLSSGAQVYLDITATGALHFGASKLGPPNAIVSESPSTADSRLASVQPAHLGQNT